MKGREILGNKVSDFPYALDRWDFSKNKKRPDTVSSSSKDLFHWICVNCNYPHSVKGAEWLAAPSNIALKESGCPNCAGRVLRPDNNLEYLFPKIAQLWHPTKNGNLKPRDFFPRSHQSVFWQCPIHDFYEQKISIKTGRPNVGCNKCNAKTSKPEIRILSELKGVFTGVEARAKVFGKELDIYLSDDKLGIEFDGEYFHRNRLLNDKKKNQFLNSKGVTVIRVREKPLKKISKHDVLVSNNTDLKKKDLDSLISSIQIVLGKRKELENYSSKKTFQFEDVYQKAILHINVPSYEMSLAALYPELVADWDRTKNGLKTPEHFTPGSQDMIHWCCSKCNYCWKASINNRTYNNSGCPNCSNRVLSQFNNLLVLYPDVAREFHPTNNGGIKPEQVFAHSNKKFWWLCKNNLDHEWEATVYNRTGNGQKCPFCTHTFPTSKYNLEYLYPDLATEYDEVMNQKPARQQLPGSNNIAHWKCNNCDHRWTAAIKSRVKNFKSGKKLSGCPKCRGPKRTAQIEDSFAFKFPLLAAQWDKDGNNLSPEEILPTSRYSAKWRCPHCEFTWTATVRGRVASKASGRCKSCRQFGHS